MHLLEIFGMSLKDILNPQFYIEHGGLWMIMFIVFAETGLFAGFFYREMHYYLLQVFLVPQIKMDLA